MTMGQLNSISQPSRLLNQGRAHARASAWYGEHRASFWVLSCQDRSHDCHAASAVSAVKILRAHFPEDSHPPIVYPVALTSTAKPDAPRYLAFMRSGEAKAISEKYGFTFLSR